jgi:N-acetyltransferase
MRHPFNEYFPEGLTLATGKVVLRPLQAEDIKHFLPLTASADLWMYFTKLLNQPEELNEWVRQAIEERTGKTRVPFTLTDKETGTVFGSTSFGNISFYDKRIEIGWTWLGKAFQGTGINHHAKFAMLQFAFERLLFERVEIKTDNLNERAKQALRKIGAKEEGILRSHMLMPGGRRRDSVYFSILKNEWPDVKSNFFKGIP